MAKKRKLRSSEPESSKNPELQSQEPPKLEPEPEQSDVQEEEVQHDGMDEDEAGGEDEEVEEEVEEDEGQSDEEDEKEGQEHRVSAEANGGGSGGITAVEDANDGGDDDSDEEPVEKVLEPFSREQLATLLKEAVENFPVLIHSVRKLADADPAQRKIFVHGLGWDTTAETLISEFGKYGEIEDCKAVTDKVSGKSKGYAFILFKHRSGARKALKEPQKKIGSRMTSCQLASSGPVSAPPPTAPLVSEYTQRKIFVSNVSSEIDPEKLLEFFKQFGEIEDGPLGLDKQTGKPKGFALFVYKSAESAKMALEEPHKNFEGHTLHCQKAIDGPKQNKPHHQQQQHYQPHYPLRKEKNKYMSGASAGSGHGHLMAPSGHGVGFNPALAAQALNPALGQALTALLATQGAGLGLNNLLGGIGGAPMNQTGQPVMNNALYGNQAGGSYGNQAGGNYGNQAGMQGAYQNLQMGQSSAGRSQPGVGHIGGPPYMGH